MCAVSGVLVMALPIPIVVDNFADYYSEQKKIEAKELKKEAQAKQAEFDVDAEKVRCDQNSCVEQFPKNLLRLPIMDLSRPSAELQDPSRNPQCPPTMASRDKQGKMEQSTINSKTIILFLIGIYAIMCSALIILFGCDSSNAQFI